LGPDVQSLFQLARRNHSANESCDHLGVVLKQPEDQSDCALAYQK
jgi:hypothetical protein